MDQRPRSPPRAVNVSEIIAPATLSWREDQPYSETYQDIYHAEDGADEVRRAFIAPSGLAGKLGSQPALLVGELGFGTGLNFAETAALCRRSRAHLHFVSFDAAPIAPAEFKLLCDRRQHRHAIYAELREAYPPLIGGWHRRYLAGGAVTLSLFWGDAAEGLDDIDGRQQHAFDIWFLDGFAPDRNPDLWTPELLARVGTLSGPGTGVATYSAASRVRRGLEAAGFTMRRIDQRPHKPQSLAGTFTGTFASTSNSPTGPPREVHVVGAGLAGASIARHLAERGVSVRVFETQARAAAGASSIPATVLHPRLLADGSALAALRSHAYLYSSALCAGLLSAPPSGALQLPGNNANAARLEAVAERYAPSGDWLALLNPSAASSVAHWDIRTPALWFPHSRVVDTPGLCNLLLDHPNIELSCRTQVAHLTEQPTVLACGIHCNAFAEANYLETAPVHGQVDVVRMTRPPTVPLLGNGYLVPQSDHLLAGTTYEYQPWALQTATQANLEQLNEVDGTHTWLSRSRATRCVTSDRTPIAGRLYDIRNEPLANVYVSTGHGSAGNVFSHFAGALVAGQICGEFAPMTRALEAAISSLRFRKRQARRGFRHGAGSRPAPGVSRS